MNKLSEQEIFVILYNLLFILLFLLWIYQDKLSLKNIITNGNLKILWLFSIVFFLISLLLNVYLLGSDVDDAVISGTKAFVQDQANPYSEKVVVHLLNGEKVFGFYHYFPSDLIIYSIIFIIFSPLESLSSIFVDSWFLIGNFIFLILSYFVVRKILQEPDIRLIPSYVIVTSFFLFSNSSLMVLYFVIGYFCFYNLKNKNLGVISYILAAGVKYMTGLLLMVQAMEEAMQVKKKEDLIFLKPYILGSVVFLVTIIPFGVIDILNATFLYQGDIVARAKVAGIYGPILVELALLLDILAFYNIIFLISAILSFIVAFKFGNNTYERQMIISFLFMFILPFYGTELIIVSLLLWYFHLFDKELKSRIK